MNELKEFVQTKPKTNVPSYIRMLSLKVNEREVLTSQQSHLNEFALPNFPIIFN